MSQAVVLRDLLRDRHWQTYNTFCKQYDKVARGIDSSYVGTYPSRAQLFRWLAGELKGLPYPRHCEVLEAMFPGVRVAEMFEPSTRTAVDPGRSEGAPEAAPPAVEANASAVPAGPVGSLSSRSSTLTSPVEMDEPPVSALGSTAEQVGLTAADADELGALAGQLIDLKMDCTIDIDADGWSTVTYCFELLNLTQTPVKRILCEQWFENTSGLRIEPRSDDKRRTSIQRIHDIGNMAKFACVLSPGIDPGEVGTISYVTQGGRFRHDHYWQQSTFRHTRQFALTIRHHGVEMLTGCSATEDRSDGTQLLATSDLFCIEEAGTAVITLIRERLEPGQAVTIRWEVARASA